VICCRWTGCGLRRNGSIRCPVNDGQDTMRGLTRDDCFIPVVLHLNFELKITSKPVDGKYLVRAYPPSLHKHSLIAIRKLDINRLRLNGRNGIRNVINHFNKNGIIVPDEMSLEPGSHILYDLVMLVKDLRHNGVVGSGGNHELKQSVTRIGNIGRLYKSLLGKLVRGLDVFAVPKVKAGDALQWFICGEFPRHGNLIGTGELLLTGI
jgi:hypothetical protein